MRILQNTFLNNVSDFYFRANPTGKSRSNGKKDLIRDTFEIQSSPKNDVQEHITGMKFMLAKAQSLKPVEHEAMLIRAIKMEDSFKKEHPDYYIDYRPFKALGDFYLYKENMPSNALAYYERAIDALMEYVNDKEKTNIRTLKEISVKCNGENKKVEQYCRDLREYNKKQIFQKVTSKRPEVPKESMEYLRNHIEDAKLYKKVGQLGQMYESIGKCYDAMEIKDVYGIYLNVARDFQQGSEKADKILKRRSKGFRYFMDLYEKD